MTDEQVIGSLMQMARESGQRGWWHAYGDIPQSVYIALETDTTSLHTYERMAIPGLLQTPAYAQAVIGETIPLLTAEEAGTRLKVRLRRQHRIYDPAYTLRLWVVLEESALRRVVDSPDVMREQVEHLDKPSDVQQYGVLYGRLQAHSLDPDSSRDFITDVSKTYMDAASRP